jgi:hypothetical protein
MRRSRVLMQTAAACALVLSLAGCGSGNPKPAPAPTGSATTSPSPTGEVPPTMPAEAKGTSEAAAKAFVRHYLNVLSYSVRSHDVGALRDLGEPSCESCVGVISKIQAIYAKGGHAAGRGYGAKSMSAQQSTTTEREMVVSVRIIAYPQIVYATPQAKPKRSTRSETQAKFWLVRSGSGWLVRDWAGI